MVEASNDIPDDEQCILDGDPAVVIDIGLFDVKIRRYIADIMIQYQVNIDEIDPAVVIYIARGIWFGQVQQENLGIVVRTLSGEFRIGVNNIEFRGFLQGAGDEDVVQGLGVAFVNIGILFPGRQECNQVT